MSQRRKSAVTMPETRLRSCNRVWLSSRRPEYRLPTLSPNVELKSYLQQNRRLPKSTTAGAHRQQQHDTFTTSSGGNRGTAFWTR